MTRSKYVRKLDHIRYHTYLLQYYLYVCCICKYIFILCINAYIVHLCVLPASTVVSTGNINVILYFSKINNNNEFLLILYSHYIVEPREDTFQFMPIAINFDIFIL